MNVYVELTQQFNAGRFRAILSSGQAVVLHRLAIMSKDGDWIVREDDEALAHVLAVLSERGAAYRFGAPLDARWMAGGWSAHLEFRQGPLRVRTDFVTRPPRLSEPRLRQLWHEQEGRDLPFLDLPDLAELKKTNRERDYAILGDLARLMPTVAGQLLYSRSARDLARLGAEQPDQARRLASQRPLLARLDQPLAALEAALDAERRELIHANEARLAAYLQAAEHWRELWPEVQREVADMPLPQAHETVVRRAEGVLPFRVEEPPHA
jgi:hypothetical protein